jgi:hypothetical protein
MSEELDGLIEMGRTIRMRAEQGTRGAALPAAASRSRMIPSHGTGLTGRRRDWRKGTERAECFLSGLAGWRCLGLFSCLFGTTEVVPFPKPSRARAPAPHEQMRIRGRGSETQGPSTSLGMTDGKTHLVRG